jgi:chaperonin GroEL
MHTIAKEIELKDAVENVGAQIMRKRPERIGAAIGDGITTATLLAHALLAEGIPISTRAPVRST